ncbi:MAG: c-type cytochrome [Actinomycetota bacterium]|nr:c-type cytochrome [Actinomycetota bacterium]
MGQAPWTGLRPEVVATAVVLAVGAACGGQPSPKQEAQHAAQEAIDTYGCGSCHTIPGIRGADGLVGPPLTRFHERAYIAGQLPNTPENLVHWIMNPQEVEPGTAMPDLEVVEEDARAIAAYLHEPK